MVVHSVLRETWPFTRHRVEISLSRVSYGSHVRTIWFIPGKNDSGQPRAQDPQRHRCDLHGLRRVHKTRHIESKMRIYSQARFETPKYGDVA